MTVLQEPRERLRPGGERWLMSTHKDLCQHRENVEEKGIRLSFVYLKKCCGTWQSPSENHWKGTGTEVGLPSTVWNVWVFDFVQGSFHHTVILRVGLLKLRTVKQIKGLS